MSRLTFPYRHRLVRRPDFQACYATGRRFFSKNFVVFARIQEPLPVKELEPKLELAEERAENHETLGTVVNNGDAQKAFLSANVHPLPCKQCADMAAFDDIEGVHAMEQDFLGWRLGLAVTKKTGCAVQRNRVKRVLREFIRLNQHELPENVDIVVVPKRHLRPRRVSLDYVTHELLPLLVEIRRYSMQKPDMSQKPNKS